MTSKNGAKQELNWLPDLPKIKAEIDDRTYDWIFDPPLSDVTQVTENIYLTSLGGLTKSNFKKYQFQCIFDFCEKILYTPEGIEYYKFSILDDINQNICDNFDLIVDQLHENEQKGTKTLLHCYGGASRSASMVIAYLMKFKRLSLHDAFNHLRECRWSLFLNPGFVRQLIDYEMKLFGKTSTKIVKVRNETKRLATEVPDFFIDEHTDIIDMYFGHIERGEHPTKYPSLPYD